ncbi:hypothetical protein SAY87_024500 [Trapa incisa]|uniref:Uncharacterized protein n=1 Tax=Trapa incisa TaxID=236973 RepID=A0AAN7GKY4_9MYRT|nr:hypothetical protein SAY87_024500 [Trapa incisa]
MHRQLQWSPTPGDQLPAGDLGDTSDTRRGGSTSFEDASLCSSAGMTDHNLNCRRGSHPNRRRSSFIRHHRES